MSSSTHGMLLEDQELITCRLAYIFSTDLSRLSLDLALDLVAQPVPSMSRGCSTILSG